jgi:hypothetical protein
MTLRFGLKEATIQKICDVLARYPQVEKACCMARELKGTIRTDPILT